MVAAFLASISLYCQTTCLVTSYLLGNTLVMHY